MPVVTVGSTVTVTVALGIATPSLVGNGAGAVTHPIDRAGTVFPRGTGCFLVAFPADWSGFGSRGRTGGAWTRHCDAGEGPRTRRLPRACRIETRQGRSKERQGARGGRPDPDRLVRTGRHQRPVGQPERSHLGRQSSPQSRPLILSRSSPGMEASGRGSPRTGRSRRAGAVEDIQLARRKGPCDGGESCVARTKIWSRPYEPESVLTKPHLVMAS